jgi:cyclase
MLAAQPRQEFEHTKLAEGVYAFVRPESPVGTSGNVLAVVGEKSVLVVDAGLGAREIIASIREITPLPVRYLVTTHWHEDHNDENYLYREAFPSVEIIAHPETRRLQIKDWPNYQEFANNGAPKTLESVRERLAKGVRRDGTPLSDDDRRMLNGMTAALEADIPRLKAAKLTLPDTTFHDELTVDLGKREVRLMHLGRANTAGDVVAYVPDAKVLATGDVVAAPTPYCTECYPRENVAVLDKLLALNAALILPGHGPVMRDAQYVRLLRDLYAFTVAQASGAAKSGLSLDDARKKISFAEFRDKMAEGNPMRATAFDQFYAMPAVERAYKEAKGEALTE